MPTLTGSIADILGTQFDHKRTAITVTSNAAQIGYFDGAGELHLGGARVAENGTFSITLPSTAEIDGLAYFVSIDYPDPAAAKGRGIWTSGWFALTADATLADVASIATPQAVPIESLQVKIDEAADGVRTDTLTAAADAVDAASAAATSQTAAAGSATAAQTAKTAAETARDTAQAAAVTATAPTDSTMADKINTAGTATQTALDARFASKANPTFSGSVALPGGGPSLRRPVNGSVTIDGATAKALPGDKVAYSFAATIKGGFSGDTGGTPTFAWGANDFIRTGSTSGDVAGIGNLIARETEIHLYTPGAVVGTAMKALQLDCKIEASAAGATVQSMFGLYVTALSDSSAGSAVTNAYGIYVEAPTVAASGDKYGLYVNGASKFVGAVNVVGATTLSGGTLSHTGGDAKFTGPSSANSQGSAAGVHVGSIGGNYGLNLADGTNTWTIDTSGGNLRFMKAGVEEEAHLDFSGNLTLRGAIQTLRIGSGNPTQTTAPSAGGAGALPATPAGYILIPINGTNRLVAYY